MDYFNILGTYKLKHTLYPTIDEDLTTDKEEWDRYSGFRVLRKGSIFNIVSKEVFCKVRKYNEDETEYFMDYACDFDYIAYMKSNHYRFIMINSLEDFEEVSRKEQIKKQ